MQASDEFRNLILKEAIIQEGKSATGGKKRKEMSRQNVGHERGRDARKVTLTLGEFSLCIAFGGEGKGESISKWLVEDDLVL